MADVKFGIKTGCNDFFILRDLTDKLKDKELKAVVNNVENLETISDVKSEKLRVVQNGFNEIWLIEEKLLKPMITSPKDVRYYTCPINELPYSLLLIKADKELLKKKYPYAHLYISGAEKNNIHNASSLASRKNWYELGEKTIPDLSFNYVINEFGRTFLIKAYSNNNFHNIYSKNKSKTIWLYMNSTISWLIQQLIMRSNLGDGAGKIETYELADFPVPDIDLESLEVDLGETKNFKEELGSLESLKTVNPERIKLDSAILGAIGYKVKKERDEVLLELYRATYQLIDARLQKAQSLKGIKSQRNKIEFSVYVEQLKHLIEEENLKPKNGLTFARQIQKLAAQITSEIALQKKILTAYWKELYNEVFDEKFIAAKAQTKLF